MVLEASSTINRAQDLPEVPKLSEKQWEAINFFQQLCGELALKIDWQPGDVSFVLNHVALHARTAYEDWPVFVSGTRVEGNMV